MNAVDAVGTIAEVLSWIGLGVGLPLLAIVLLVKVHDDSWLPQEVVVVEDESGRARARWFAAGDFRERPLRADEAHHWHGREDVDAFVSERHPSLMRFEPRRPLLHAFQVLGITLAGVGAAAVALSIVLLFVG
ncbi:MULTISPECIES: hypothetical protein [unclassified Microbacterium]|uniref:hypothetical protein n=1 Tax=unclassified Microbacterium TaxID=2609290 RepID=UPI000CFE245A|nr:MULTISPECIES: hypothetical protein [unclassified Microbacterium]PQZ55022.1 hypothetical protein CQ032_12060 [Microbacterium sp. MYb43]PQZ81533.1 hypothetical protein CQ031_04755 [Microbacterium sp. MYb40]PRB21515.1 hypothetical protein CQ040_09150 [Microbacterium sp. MYb54]PRB30080.1 hypothetical protein CQ037_06770 [Microbacterium sp. MYb50]PRB67762.1 hypothetical protein CQ021_07205 [Microbacterium sp. MYb24]